MALACLAVSMYIVNLAILLHSKYISFRFFDFKDAQGLVPARHKGHACPELWITSSPRATIAHLRVNKYSHWTRCFFIIEDLIKIDDAGVA